MLYYNLMRAGLSRWIPPIAALMYQYDGVETLLGFEEEYPVNVLNTIVLSVAEYPQYEREERLMKALTNLPFLFFRARRGTWNWKPLEVTLMEFLLDIRTSEPLICWMCREADPKPRELRDWMMVRLPAVCV